MIGDAGKSIATTSRYVSIAHEECTGNEGVRSWTFG
jgi:predicted secreted protein